MNETKPLLGINDKPSALQWITLSLQHLFAMIWRNCISTILN